MPKSELKEKKETNSTQDKVWTVQDIMERHFC